MKSLVLKYSTTEISLVDLENCTTPVFIGLEVIDIEHDCFAKKYQLLSTAKSGVWYFYRDNDNFWDYYESFSGILRRALENRNMVRVFVFDNIDEFINWYKK